jgi:hypothetical protein
MPLIAVTTLTDAGAATGVAVVAAAATRATHARRCGDGEATGTRIGDARVEMAAVGIETWGVGQQVGLDHVGLAPAAAAAVRAVVVVVVIAAVGVTRAQENDRACGAVPSS